jgi:hypothetical protein
MTINQDGSSEYRPGYTITNHLTANHINAVSAADMVKNGLSNLSINHVASLPFFITKATFFTGISNGVSPARQDRSTVCQQTDS